MNRLLIFLTLLEVSIFTVHGLACNSGNPCALDTYYSSANGYQCLQRGNFAYCSCPGGDYEIDAPCRLCNRVDGRKNPCNAALPNFAFCLETRDYGTSYVCLFSDANGNPYATTDYDGSPAATVTTTSTTTTQAPTAPPCSNGGVLVGTLCNCPSGFSGPFCQIRNEAQLCDNIICKNNGHCAIRNFNGPYESLCACQPGFFGEYCEIQGNLGSCVSGSCNNGGACKEFVSRSTKYAYCDCAPGYNGVKCENRYFPCPAAGNWIDYELFTQGKYFVCTALTSGGFRIERRSCPKGLRFNMNLNVCTK